MNKRTAITTGFVGYLLLVNPIAADDIVNGWSASYSGGSSRISGVVSEWSRTLFALNTGTATCGHPGYWSLPMGASEADRFKRAALLAAYISQKGVNLRCEGSRVTDFHIEE